ncbi:MULTISPECIES: lipoyl(octanoyl) transferase LipB [unclassified Microcoleus]|uniref:lipoyl(octanoyl) transferase LipB n=1 Tax=unclassified Microcoleus TaxID=2642155 RepID=UPI0025EB4AE6|nr:MULTISPECIES: lipoyl(octanoyl) transferase LipB [unclassified Microcoleus]
MLSPLSHKPLIPEPCLLFDWGQVPYSQAWEVQQKLVQERRDNPDLPDVLILLEHPPVYTLGLGSKLEFLKFDPSQTHAELHRVERGGEVTYHCPGQLVGYPILNLRRHQQDLHWYLRQLEEVLLSVLEVFGLKGSRVPGMTGVWVDGCKVGAIGIKVSRWITMHGFALNVCPDLSGFGQIVPCGIPDRPVGSLEQFIPGIELDRVRAIVVAEFARVFGVEIVRSDREIVRSDQTAVETASTKTRTAVETASTKTKSASAD